MRRPDIEKIFTRLFSAGGAVVLLATANPCLAEMNIERAQLVSLLEHEMLTNTAWVRIHAAEALLDNGQSNRIRDSFVFEADTASAPYRIGVWRVLARCSTDGERNRYVERIRAVSRDTGAVDRISAAESLGKLNTVSRADRDFIRQWAGSADDATAAFPRWLLVLSSNPAERPNDEAMLAGLLSSSDPVARLRAAFALGRLADLSPDSMARFRRQLRSEPADSIARAYLVTGLLLHSPESSAAGLLEAEAIHYLNNGKPNEQLEVGIVIGLRGKSEGLKTLIPVLSNPESDARIGAASGMLHLLK